MPVLSRTADYTSRDFESARRRLFDMVKSARPSWADETVANVGNIIVELGAHIVDVLAFMMDANAAEAFVSTAQRRESLIALGRAVGYELSTANAATVDITFTLSSAATAPVTIEAGTVIRTEDKLDVIRFRLLEDVVIGVGEVSAVGSAEHSEEQTKSIDASGLKNLNVYLDQTPYLDGSATVTSTVDGAFTEEDSLLSSGASDQHFTVMVNSSDQAIVRFGDGVNGKAPAGTVNITYKTGGGEAGNVEAGALRVIESVIVDAAGRSVQISATNEDAASGGAERETMEEARAAIPQSVRAAGSRSITKDDYEINARAVSGVSRALMVTNNEDATVAENAGVIYVVPSGGGTASEALLDSVVEMVTVTRPGPPTFAVTALTAVYVEVDVSIRATFSADPSTVANSIRTMLASWFALLDSSGAPNENVGFGSDLDGILAWSDVFNAVRDTDGVRRIQPFDFRLNEAAADVNLLVREFPILGDITIVDAQTGEAV